MQGKVGILIPTYNRPGFVLDLCRFYTQFNAFNFVIILGDSSSFKFFAQNSKTIKNFPNLEIIQVRCHKEGPHEALLSITRIAVGRKIPYCLFTGDDDYVFIPSLPVLTRYLKMNDKFRSVRGRALLVGVERASRSNSAQRITFYQRYWHHRDITHRYPLERLEFLLENYINLQFTLHRTSEFEEQLAAKTGLTTGFFQEYSESFNSIIKGESKFFNVPFLIRLSHNYYGGNSYETHLKDRSNNGPNLFFNLIYTNEVKKLTNNVIRSISLKKKYKTKDDEYIKKLIANKLYASLNKVSKNIKPKKNKLLILIWCRIHLQKFKLRVHLDEIKYIEKFVASYERKHQFD